MDSLSSIMCWYRSQTVPLPSWLARPVGIGQHEELILHITLTFIRKNITRPCQKGTLAVSLTMCKDKT